MSFMNYMKHCHHENSIMINNNNNVFFLEGQSVNYRHKLIRDLMRKDIYNPDVRPVKNLTDVVQVKIRITLHQITDIVCIQY